jgi:hypothetical protein
VSVGSDNGTAFVEEVVQLVAKGLRDHPEVTYDLPPPEFRKSGAHD